VSRVSSEYTPAHRKSIPDDVFDVPFLGARGSRNRHVSFDRRVSGQLAYLTRCCRSITGDARNEPPRRPPVLMLETLYPSGPEEKTLLANGGERQG
jgi:hypothetical protein